MIRLGEVEKKILNALLDRYEKSRTYSGKNARTQRFRVKAEEIWPAYKDNFTDVTEVEDFERRVAAVEEEGLIVVLRGKNGEIQSIQAATDRIQEYYDLLHRTEKKELQKKELQLYQSCAECGGILGAFCCEQEQLLSAGKKAAYQQTRAEGYIALLKRIEENQEPLYERELSIQVMSDSKAFERSYRKTVCSILRKYGDFEEILEGITDEREIQIALLEEYRIYTNPAYLYFRGEAKIVYEDGSETEIRHALPMAISSDLLDRVSAIRVCSDRVITIENLTSFHRFSEPGFFCIYLAGYHSSHKTGFLKKISASEQKQWFHFGDLDPDGFEILKNLRRKSGLDFQPYRMDSDTLEKYRRYAKPLEEQDRVKAKGMIEAGMFRDVLSYMLEENIKLEQEILMCSGGSATI